MIMANKLSYTTGLLLLLAMIAGRANAQLYINDSVLISAGATVYVDGSLVLGTNASTDLKGRLESWGYFQNLGNSFIRCTPSGRLLVTTPQFDTGRIDIGISTNNRVLIYHETGWDVALELGLKDTVYRNPEIGGPTVDTGIVKRTWDVVTWGEIVYPYLEFSWDASEELLFDRNNAVMTAWRQAFYDPGLKFIDKGSAIPLGGNRYKLGGRTIYLLDGQYSFTISDTTSHIMTNVPSKVPVALAATNVSETTFRAVWKQPYDPFSYQVQISTDSLFTTVLNNVTVWFDTTYQFGGLLPATTYFYRVRSTIMPGNTAYSNTIAVRTHTPEALADFRTRATGLFNEVQTWEYNYVDTLYKPATIIPFNHNIAVNTGDTLLLDSIYTVPTGKQFVMKSSSRMEVLPAGKFTISGIADFNSQPVVFNSDATGTATLGQITGSLINAGNVTVERFIPAKAVRRFNFLAAPVTTTIASSWQQQVHITGPGTGGTPCAGANGTSTINSNGFDVTGTNAASMFYYDEATPSKWLSIPNTTGTNLIPGKGFRVNIRGDRSLGCALLAANPPLPGDVVLRATGQPAIGAVIVPLQTASAEGYTLLGNPYQSPIRFSEVLNANPIMAPVYWTYSPQNNSGTYSVYNVYTNYMLNAPAGYQNPNIIAPGQAFFVESYGANDIFFLENMKDDQQQAGMFRTTTVTDRVIAGLKTNAGAHLDEVLIDFNPDGTTTGLVPGWDVRSMNSGTRIATMKDGEQLAMQARPLPTSTPDTVALFVDAVAGSYKLAFSQHQQFSGNIYLLDRFSAAVQNIKNDTGYTFSVTADTNTKGGNRFALIFQEGSPLAANTLSTTARKERDGTVKVDWSVKNETGISQYEVERSPDARNFHYMARQGADGTEGASSYSWTDLHPETTSYYRIKVQQTDGQVFYGNVVRVNSGDAGASATLFPNPVRDGSMFVNFRNVTAGAYELRVRNATGQEVFHTTLQLNGNEIKKIDLPNALSNGIYMVQITGTSFNFNQNIHINK